MQLPLLVPSSDWRPPRLADLPNWGSAKRVSIDIETCDPHLKTLGPGVRRGGYIAGFSFALEDANKGYYVPLRHDGGDNVEDVAQALGWLREQAQKFTGEIVGANLSYDLDFLAEAGIHFPNVRRFRDCQIAEPLIDELQMSFSLESICQKYLGIGKSEDVLREAAIAYGIDPKKDLHLLPARFVGAYAEDDALLPLRVLRRQEQEIDNQDLWRIYDMESDLLPVLVRMRRRGIRIDQDKLAQVEKWSVEQEKMALSSIQRDTGFNIPLNTCWQASMLVPALQAIGAKIPLTPKTRKPSIDKDFLKSIKHPVAEALNRARRVNKIRTTFVNSIREHMTNGRIHCVINQLRKSEDDDEDGEGQGARYGRVSSSSPNMQQQPARDPEIGPLWRSIYIPEEGMLWCSADFSSQEPRQTVHYAASTKLGNVKIGNTWIDANESAGMVAEEYRKNPKLDLHQWMSDITGIPRKQAKDIFLGLCYGMGGAKLCHSLGLPTVMVVWDKEANKMHRADTEEGKRAAVRGGRIFEGAGQEGQLILDKFAAKVPFVSALYKVCEKQAKKLGYVRTQEGRKCRFPQDEFGNYDWTHKSLNRIIQGSSSDQTKKAMIAIDAAGHFLQLQVHDECCASVKDKAEAEMISSIMENCYTMCIPSRVDCEVGKSWGEAN